MKIVKDENYIEQWIKPTEQLPDEFILVHLKPVRGKQTKGWWSGTVWDGMRVYRKHEIDHWAHLYNPNRRA
jgi:hypothetical protein